MSKLKAVSPWLLGGAALAVALRLIGICWGLPDPFNADEPHLMHLAVSFGGGTLKPYLFKYPTLWPYLLALAYGVYFALWSTFGLRKGVVDFIGLYAWEPTGFFLIGRLLSAGLQLAALALLFAHERRERPTGVPWGSLLLALSPVLVEAAHAAKPDSMMLLFATAAWLWALRVQAGGARRDYWVCGAALGLAFTTQFTALPLFLLLPLAHLLSAGRRRHRWLLEGLAAAAAAFLIGTPYSALDFPRFWAGLRDTAALAELEARDQSAILRQVLRNLWNFAAQGSIAGPAALIGLVALLSKRTARGLLLAGPVAGYLFVLGANPDGGWPRYLIGAAPGLALLAAQGLSMLEKRRWATALLAALALGPGLLQSWLYSTDLRRPDTRHEAAAWLRENIPPGKTILLDSLHASPRAVIDKAQLAELAAQAQAAGSPRARLYRGMAATHPGGGWRVFRIQRSARELRSGPEHVRSSQADAPTLDVSGGLAAARARGVDFVVTSGYGIQRANAPELSRFFDELQREPMIAVFTPVPQLVNGPVLRVYRLKAYLRRQTPV